MFAGSYILDASDASIVRDAFADAFFPGTSTIQTRARYFLFVPWIYCQLFAAGKRDRPSDVPDLTPYWVYQVKDGAKIERHAPVLPLNRDHARIGVLRRSVAAYRMVFGQARQEDLIVYLLSRFTEEETSRFVADLRINLEPPRKDQR